MAGAFTSLEYAAPAPHARRTVWLATLVACAMYAPAVLAAVVVRALATTIAGAFPTPQLLAGTLRFTPISLSPLLLGLVLLAILRERPTDP